MAHQIFTFFNSDIISYPKALRSRVPANTFVSSANIRNFKVSEQFGKSFMYIRNRTGPSELPCGIPQVTVCAGNNIPQMIILSPIRKIGKLNNNWKVAHLLSQEV